MREKNRTVAVFIALFLFSLLLMGLDKLGWLDWFKGPVESLSGPLKKRIQQNSAGFKKRKELDLEQALFLADEVASLRRENASLLVEREILKEENQAMKKLLGAPLPPSWQFRPTRVLGVKEGVMTLNQGEKEGVKESQIVIFEDVLVGRVIEVLPRLSRVQILTHKDCQLAVKLIDSKEEGMVKARPGGALILEVLQEVELAKDQLVATSGEEEVYPVDLLVGRVDLIEEEETAVYKQAVLEPLVDYETLTEVFIVED